MTGTNSYQIGEVSSNFDGPCVTSLNLIGQFAVTACRRIGNSNDFILQGVSLPAELKTNHFLFGRLEDYARKIPASIAKLHPDVPPPPEALLNEKRILANQGKVKFHRTYIVHMCTCVNILVRTCTNIAKTLYKHFTCLYIPVHSCTCLYINVKTLYIFECNFFFRNCHTSTSSSKTNTM